MKLLIPLFSPPTGTWGGLTRVVAVAEAAREAGHQVAFCATGYVEETLRQRGYRVYATPPTTMFGLPPSFSRIIERRSQYVSPPIRPGKSFGNMWLVLLGTGVTNTRYLRRLVATEIEAIEDFGADRLFTDVDPGAYVAAHITSLPLAASYAHIGTHGSGSLAWRIVARSLARVLNSYGRPALTPDKLCFRDSVLKIIPSIPELDDTDPSRPDVRYVGQLLGPIHAAPVSGWTLDPTGATSLPTQAPDRSRWRRCSGSCPRCSREATSGASSVGRASRRPTRSVPSLSILTCQPATSCLTATGPSATADRTPSSNPSPTACHCWSFRAPSLSGATTPKRSPRRASAIWERSRTLGSPGSRKSWRPRTTVQFARQS